MISVRNVFKIYAGGPTPLRALSNVSVEIAAGEFVSVTGPSGCGKSTLLHLLGGLDRPTKGDVVVDGLELQSAREVELDVYRRRKIGVVFQFFHLLPTLTALENVALPLLLDGMDTATAVQRARKKIEEVELRHRETAYPHRMSGGELQRIAIARALVHDPALLLADEPTGNLDSANSDRVLEVLQKISSQGHTTMVVVTHSESVAAAASRRIPMRDGEIVESSMK